MRLTIHVLSQNLDPPGVAEKKGTQNCSHQLRFVESRPNPPVPWLPSGND